MVDINYHRVTKIYPPRLKQAGTAIWIELSIEIGHDQRHDITLSVSTLEEGHRLLKQLQATEILEVSI